MFLTSSPLAHSSFTEEISGHILSSKAFNEVSHGAVGSYFYVSDTAVFLDWDLLLLLLLHFFPHFHWLNKINKSKITRKIQSVLKNKTTHCHSQLVMPPTILSLLFLFKWLKNTEVLKVFWQAKAKLSLLTQVAWSRVTDDTDGTDGVADILHSYALWRH